MQKGSALHNWSSFRKVRMAAQSGVSRSHHRIDQAVLVDLNASYTHYALFARGLQLNFWVQDPKPDNEKKSAR
jgi:hypothetical protein